MLRRLRSRSDQAADVTLLVALAVVAACHDPSKGSWRVERIPAPALAGSRLAGAAEHPALVYLAPGL